MSKPKKQKTPHSEKLQLKTASAMMGTGSNIMSSHMDRAIAWNNYDKTSRLASEQSASNAEALEKQSKQNKLKNRTNIGKSLVGGDIGIGTIASKSGVSKSQRLAKSAANAFKSGANTLKTGNAVMAIDNENERLEFCLIRLYW